ncbi:hypothetical protein BC936DRAFT_149943 [Jimgerdemannia flammicorona]|uniref:F-box domain-containing protein n=1 Tax=Jimgerdemannia flammicorona TaxID=994334 RepID=A0A433CZU1_9FUNG|nr:hypothetical protein BC936DRAFT_149943 [Jimgerdemannia flammicorona]
MPSKHCTKRTHKPRPQPAYEFALPGPIATTNRYALLSPESESCPREHRRPPRLPPEVWGLVLSQLPFYVLWGLRAVCRLWRDEIEFQLPWRLRKQHRIVTGIANRSKGEGVVTCMGRRCDVYGAAFLADFMV